MWRKPIFRMVTRMGIRHAKPYTLRGGPLTKLEQRSDSQTHVLYLHQVALPAGVLDLIIYSSTDSDLLKDPSAPEHAPSEPATSLFLHSSNSSKISKDSTISANHRRFHSSSLSLPRNRRRTSSCSSSSKGSSTNSSTSLSERSSHSITTHSPSPSVGPFVIDMIRGSSTALSLEDTIKESLEVAKAVAADEIRTETEVGFEGDDEAEDEAEFSARGTMDIRVDRVFDPGITADSLVPASGGVLGRGL
ncbi:hypothetical protein Tco_0825573 [Tanacetum coccineum]